MGKLSRLGRRRIPSKDGAPLPFTNLSELALLSRFNGRAPMSATVSPTKQCPKTGRRASGSRIEVAGGPQGDHRTGEGERKSEAGPLCRSLRHPSKQVPAGVVARKKSVPVGARARVQPRARRAILCSEPRAGQAASRPSGEGGRISNGEGHKSQRGTPQLPLAPGRQLRTCPPSNILWRGRHQKPVRHGQVCLSTPAGPTLREPKKGQPEKIILNVEIPRQPPFAPKCSEWDKPKKADGPRRTYK